ncbi:MAG: class I SAM-dependent methyltransferase, partial [Thermodesulfobacteriota bacterium]
MNYIEAIRSIANFIRTHRVKLNDALLAKRLAGNLEYSFTTDYVSCLTSIWEQHLAGFKGKDNIRFLEIGSFEGRSTIWFLENILTHPTSSITCVDNFSRQGGEPRFDHNIKVSGFSNKVTKIKGRSEDVLRTLNENTFDIIYIDGNHYALNVLMDTVLSWLLLKPGGIIIFDDYEWEPER